MNILVNLLPIMDNTANQLTSESLIFLRQPRISQKTGYHLFSFMPYRINLIKYLQSQCPSFSPYPSHRLPPAYVKFAQEYKQKSNFELSSAGEVEGSYHPPRLAKLVIGMTSLVSSLGNKLNAPGINRLSHLR